MMDTNTYLIAADGPFLSKSLIAEASQNKCIIALDSAANQLANRGFKPDIILGDLDFDDEKAAEQLWGIQKTSLQPYQGKNGVLIVPAKNKNYTDLEKAVHFCDQNNADAIHILCATGGRMDHDQTNIRLLEAAYSPDRSIFLHTAYQTLLFIRDQKQFIITGKEGDYCGIFGIPQAVMFCHYGLAYGTGKNYALYAGHDSSANQIVGSLGACLDIQGSALIAHPPMYEAQRTFSAASYKEQLLILLNDLGNANTL